MEKIGEGGMGMVYRARYVVNDKHFAVKLLPSDVTDATTLERFQRELEILKKLRHPHIVRCFGGECKNKRQFYAMELVEGGTLEQLVVEYGLQMCGALAYSHEHGIVHRDVKPGNFLLTSSGRLKLSDFGLASVAAARRITAEGRTMGTYHYMAPEQIRGKEITPRADLYSLGCVFFELLTGRPPFVGESPAEILHHHIRTPAPRLAQFAPDCPAGLEQLVNDLLQKSPEARPASAEAVARRLKAVTQTIVVKPNLRPFEQAISDSAPSEMTETKSAPTIVQPMPEPVAPAPRWIVSALILGFGTLLIVIFSLLSQRSAYDHAAEALWVEALNSDSPFVQIEAARALGELGKHSESAADVVVQALQNIKDRDVKVAVALVEAVGEMGHNGKPAVGTLQKMAQAHPEPPVRIAAAQAAEKLKAAGPPGRSVWFYLNLLAVLATVGGAGWVYWKHPK